MQIKWKTLAVYGCLALGVTAAVTWRHHPAPPAVHDSKPFHCSAAEHERGECEPATVPTPPQTETTANPPFHCDCHCETKKDCVCQCYAPREYAPPGAPIHKPAPTRAKPAPSTPLDIRSRAQRADCSLVPAAAYDADPAMVLSAARARGLDAQSLAQLKACLSAHRSR